MINIKLKVENTLGIHARPAGHIVNVSGAAKSTVDLLYCGVRINAKSILNLMMLAIVPGSEVEFLIEGPDEQHVADELTELFKNKFYEDAT